MKGITSFEYILNFTQEPVGVKKCSFIATGEEVFTIYSPNWTTQSELDKLLTEDISNISIQKGTKTVASELIGKYEIPISIEINEESENLFELSEFESGTMNSSTGVNLNTTNRARSNYIYLEKGNYTISSIGEVQSIPRFHKYRDMTTSTWI